MKSGITGWLIVGGLAAGLAKVVTLAVRPAGWSRGRRKSTQREMSLQAGAESREPALADTRHQEQEQIEGQGPEGKEVSTAGEGKLPTAFFALAFALSVPIYLVGKDRLPIPVQLPVSALAAFTPMIAASILTYRRSGTVGLRELFRKALDAGKIRNKAWYLPIVLVNPLIMGLSYLVMRLAGLPLPEAQIPWLMAPAIFAVSFVFGIGEELGWQGYAFGPMQRRWGAFRAALVMGAAWALFHLIPDLQNQRAADWILMHRLGSIALRVLIAWLYNNTGGSVFAAIVFHAMSNVSWALFPNYGSHYDPFVTGVITWLAVGLVVLKWGSKTMTGDGAARVGGGGAWHREGDGDSQ